MTKLWEEASKTLTERVLTGGDAALVFWAWALAVWMAGHGGWDRFTTTMTPLFTNTSAATLLGWVVATVVLITASGTLMNRLTLPVLRVLEGYGPLWVSPVRRWRIRVWKNKRDQLRDWLNEAAGNERVLPAMEAQLHALPPRDEELMATRIGNILRAGERRPAHRYGLDAVALWAHLWLVLPEQTRTDLTQSRVGLDRTVTALAWATLSVLLGAWWWPATPIGVLIAWAIWKFWIPSAAATYATLISAVFDLHRFALYDALHHPRPPTPATEKPHGRSLTQLLWRGTGTHPPTFTHTPDPGTGQTP